MSELGPTLFDSVEEADGGTTVVPDLETAEGLLSLTALSGVGSGRALRLARAFHTSDAFNDASPESRKRAAGVLVDGFARVREVEMPDEGVRLIGYFDDDYPAALRAIKDPPAVLWVRGTLPDPDRRLAIVGTRSATPWGISMAEAMARDAVAAGVSVVSGLAIGIDIAAHRAVVAAGGRTTAILGSGIDRVTPREHAKYAAEILAAGGCLLTEQPPGGQPSARTLVARNRLQSGLSAATVVVQCGMKSGTMSTARFTREQGKVLAVPQPPHEEREHDENAGSLALISEAAPTRVLASREDAIALLDEIE